MINRFQPESAENQEFFDPEDIQKLVRRLAEVGWLTGKNYVDLETSLIHFSKKGSDRMLKLSELLKPYAPELFELPPETPKETDIVKFALAARILCPELVSPTFTEREANALVAYVAVYAIKHRGGSGNRT